jgi:hypothetical protein
VYRLLGKERNENMGQEVGMKSLLSIVKKCRENWYEHLERRNKEQVPKSELNYRRHGTRREASIFLRDRTGQGPERWRGRRRRRRSSVVVVVMMISHLSIWCLFERRIVAVII